MALDPTSLLSPTQHEVNHLRGNWGWFLVLGTALIVVGMMAIGTPVVATIVTVEVFGILLVVGGIVEMASAVWARRWGGFFLHLLSGLLYLFVGIVLLDRPALGAAGYTLVLALLFVFGGLARIVTSLSHRFTGWGWALFSGIVTFLLGIMIWRNLPEAAFWVIGTFVGIDLIFNGVSWVMLGMGLRNLPAHQGPQ